MARKSRRAQNDTAVSTAVTANIQIKKKENLLRTAAYGRLSVENETDESLQTQMSMLYQYIDEHEDLQLEDSYSDNGYSGTNFDRPEFVRLMDDVRSGKIECIVVKDLSRFGRDYLETGYYIETLFPHLNVRFISVTDEFDSIREEDRSSLAVPIKNMVNAMYAKDISKKICAAREVIKNKADSMPMGTAPFGYEHTEDKKRYVLDEENAPTVRAIFAWSRLGVSVKEIGKRLDLIGAMTPGQSRNQKVGKEVKPAEWRADTVYKILSHPGYVGDVCVGRIKQALYKAEKCHRTSPDEWTIHQNVHEPLVTREDREQIIQTMKANSTKKYSETDYHKEQREKIQDQFSGMIHCAECGHNMYYVRYLHDYKTLKKTGGHYLCPQNGGKAACGGRVVHEDFLKIFIMDQIHLLIKGMCDRKKMLDMVNTSQGGKNALLSAQKKMLALQVKISETEERQHKLYEDYADGLLDAEDYQNIKEQYVADAQRMQDELAGLEVKRKRLEKTINDYSKIVKHLEQYLDNREFNPELVHELVERVSISNTDGYEITFKCEDVYKRVIEMMEGGECE